MMNTFLPFFFNNFSVTILFICYSVTYSETLFFFFDVKLISYLCIIISHPYKSGTRRRNDDMNGMKATFRTLGCKLNYAETSYIEDKLRSIGVETTDNGNADICLVNTCSVTEMADHKCRQVIHKLVKDNPQAFVVAMCSFNRKKFPK